MMVMMAVLIVNDDDDDLSRSGHCIPYLTQNLVCSYVRMCAVWLRGVPRVACPVAITMGVIIRGGERITMLYSAPLTVACREASTGPIVF
jgi:hypothetical protein